MQYTNKNYLKEVLKTKGKASAAWAQAASNITTEILGEAGFDVVFIDMEHAPGDIQTLITQIHALKGLDTVPLVRATWNDFVLIKRILDAGAYGLLVPYVNTVEEAEEVVKAVRYPTAGIRGVAGSPRAAHYTNNSMDYMNAANNEIFVMVAVETMTAVENLEEIVKIDGIDGIFIGPNDLASSMGYLCNPKVPKVQDTIKRIENIVLPTGKTLATTSGSFEDAKAKYERGYGIITLMSDTSSMSKFARGLVDQFKGAFG